VYHIYGNGKVYHIYGNGATLLVFKVLMYGRTDVCTDSHVTTTIFQMDGVLLTRLRRAGAPLTLDYICKSYCRARFVVFFVLIGTAASQTTLISFNVHGSKKENHFTL